MRFLTIEQSGLQVRCSIRGSNLCGGAMKAKTERFTLHIDPIMPNWFAMILMGDNDTSSRPPND